MNQTQVSNLFIDFKNAPYVVRWNVTGGNYEVLYIDLKIETFVEFLLHSIQQGVV